MPIIPRFSTRLSCETRDAIYALILENGREISKKKLLDAYDKQAQYIYSLSTPTNDINKLLQQLSDLGFKIGLVTGSRPLWIEDVMKRIKNRNLFEYTISLAERTDLRPKPYPDGYIEAMSALGSTPEKTIILEDSNNGIASAKASGAFTICLREHLSPEHISKGADMYIENVKTLLTFLDEIDDKYNN